MPAYYDTQLSRIEALTKTLVANRKAAPVTPPPITPPPDPDPVPIPPETLMRIFSDAIPPFMIGTGGGGNTFDVSVDTTPPIMILVRQPTFDATPPTMVATGGEFPDSSAPKMLILSAAQSDSYPPKMFLPVTPQSDSAAPTMFVY